LGELRFGADLDGISLTTTTWRATMSTVEEGEVLFHHPTRAADGEQLRRVVMYEA